MRLFSDASSDVTDPFLRRAYVLAERGRGTTAPNPVVGCVLVRDGEVVGEGFHERAGGPHAEIVALAQAGERARGATAYVTLEPCAHEGRTPPCTAALIAAGVSHVVVGMPDPNPQVAGNGAERLREAGVDVVFAEDPLPFREQNEAWAAAVTRGRPWTQVKVALTLDGRPAISPGARTRITGAAAERITMRLRTAADAVLVGTSTLAIDDPALTVRGEDGSEAERQPLRVVLARSVAPRPDARVCAGPGGSDRCLVLAADTLPDPALAPLRDAGVRVVPYASDDGMRGALEALGSAGVVHVLAEAGPALFTALWRDDLVDELVLYHAGGMAGASAPALFCGTADVSRGNDGVRLEHVMHAREAGTAGDDAVTVWRPRT